MKHIVSAASTVCLLVTTVLHAAELTPGEQQFLDDAGRECPVLRLWPEGVAPDEPAEIGEETFSTTYANRNVLMIRNVSDPSLTILAPSPESNTGAALVLCPGGSYGILYFENVLKIAATMNERGVTVAVLKNRVPSRESGRAANHHAVQDAQRALGILRSRATEWDIHPERIGIGGFASGAHLAASASINHHRRRYEAVDQHDEISCRPDFSLLLYPSGLTCPPESRDFDPELQAERISQVATPPTLIAMTRSDRHLDGSVAYYLALLKTGVPSELHNYRNHGYRYAIRNFPFSEWADDCVRFLGDQSIIDAPPTPDPLTYLANSIEETAIPPGLTIGDQRLRQVLQRDCPVIPVWPEGRGPDETLAPRPEVVSARSRGGSALNIRDVTQPSLTLVQPPEATRTGRAIIVCPGGAYQGLAAEHEGARVCEWLNEQGITGILLKYRVPRRDEGFPKHHHALQDLQRSMRIIRSNADDWGIDAHDLGVCGFSAGGNLCAALCTNFETDAYEPLDEIDEQRCRPDFAILAYPAYLTDPIDSDNVDPLMLNLSRDATPPMFMTSARNDRFTRGMLNWFLDLRAAHIRAECHVYAAGGHGGGIDPVSYPASEWTAACERWLGDLERE